MYVDYGRTCIKNMDFDQIVESMQPIWVNLFPIKNKNIKFVRYDVCRYIFCNSRFLILEMQ